MSPSEGGFLIASPYLSDPHFFRTVVYILRHDSEGTFGVVINRPGDLDLDGAFAESLGHSPRRTDSVYWGGPVEGPLLAIHNLSGLGEPCSADSGPPEDASVWFTSDEDQLRLLADRQDQQVRFIAGCSGWSAGQLEAELRVGGWLVANADQADLFGDSGPLWETLIRKQGREVLGDLVPSSQADFDPSLN
ncbi:hypothetical protein FF011L_41750 [Roseimaritima multifibrata]|uniref:Uncharacterized protein n=1 Tax=Roseimaritima multifibrata TaxID=1930274 RepID=A0A517MKG7_9BACT|nr:YqgE/AlgH family protein [Roseimaritima multifibrata]QDS95379.1 hypothetical protein FF011L_41750 [Roseimaritima multifibrata]